MLKGGLVYKSIVSSFTQTYRFRILKTETGL